ncbi:DUF805 domain-containing protein [Pseudomonas otitidis]|uniref:DUF805 domain-containing protein n=1 Tax=Metapseudomonas otitidis TaxID=319939 RepID=UPI0024AD06EA|nr:DUF805 domain-containing protein [Pseudomonas otitidis]MDI6528753.1 DUF805 domain-containing protein [Pseudomonas otitidis]
MSDARYKIVFEGELMPGAALDSVKENLARLFKSDADKIDALFNGRPVALKRDLEDGEADKYLAALQRAGASVRKEPDIAAGLSLVETEDHPNPDAAPQAAEDQPDMTCPKCGHTQPKAIECQACGIVIEKFLARQAHLAESTPAVVAPATVAASPYATPQAQVGEALPEFGDLRPFGVTGRIGRMRYLAWSMVLILAALPVVGLTALLMSQFPVIGGILFALEIIALVVVNVQFGVQRLHDIGWSGWLYLLNFVPFIGSVFPLLMMVIPGTQGPNRYGQIQPPNSTSVLVMAWISIGSGILAVLAIIGVLMFAGVGALSALDSDFSDSSYEMPADVDGSDYAAAPADEAEYSDDQAEEAEAPAEQDDYESN